MADTREWLIARLQRVVSTLKPGVTFTLPGSTAPHRAIETDLSTTAEAAALGAKPRVWGKLRGIQRLSPEEFPFVEVVTAPGRTDIVEAHDQDFYRATMAIALYGYHYDPQQGEMGYAQPLRERLNSMRADLILAVEAFPFWTGPDIGENVAAIQRVGLCETVLESQETETPSDAPDGYVRLVYRITYLFNVREP